ncbi:hypothetical protein [Bradyrhizobium sp. USDA 10063]
MSTKLALPKVAFIVVVAATAFTETSANAAQYRPSSNRLRPYERNSEHHSPEQIEQITASIRQWGWTRPILAAANSSPSPRCRSIVALGWSDQQKRIYVIADNALELPLSEVRATLFGRADGTRFPAGQLRKAFESPWRCKIVSALIATSRRVRSSGSIDGLRSARRPGLERHGSVCFNDGELRSQPARYYERNAIEHLAVKALLRRQLEQIVTSALSRNHKALH